MSLSNRITRCPIPYDADHGHDARALVPWADAALADLIAGTAGCSPYLRGLLRHEGAWLETAALRPEQALRDLLPDLVADIDPHSGPRASADLAVALRRAKRRAALLIALADLGGVWDLDQVTGALTALADAAAGLAFDAA
ncbi:MAG: glutamine-synthetase adenylyltransferase, partial [Paracoccaceae bacterium]